MKESEGSKKYVMECAKCGFRRNTTDILEIHGIEPVFCSCGNILLPYEVATQGFFTIIKKVYDQPTPKKTGHVYLFHEIGTSNYKIGSTIDVKNRFKQVSGASGRNLEIIYSTQISSQSYRQGETALLAKYRKYKTSGEWLTADQSVAYNIVRDIQLFEHGGDITATEVTQ